MSTATMLSLYVAFRLLDAVVLLAWRKAKSEWHRFYNRHNPYRSWGGNVEIRCGKGASNVPDAKDGAIILISADGRTFTSFGDTTRRPGDTRWKAKTWWGSV